MRNSQYMVYEEGDLVLCTVEKIEGAAVFVKIESGGRGSIVMSEIAPGRIRNLREYIVLNKKIVCKILRHATDENHIELSLRRVTAKERKELMETFQKERGAQNLLKTILKEKAGPIIEKITKKEKVIEMLERSKDAPQELENIAGKENAAKILENIGKQKEKKAIIKKRMKLTTDSPNGLQDLKETLTLKKAVVKYQGAGIYTLIAETKGFKETNIIMKQIIEDIEKEVKRRNMNFELIEEK